MIRFKEKYLNELPYDKDVYIQYLDDEQDELNKWHGLSFQSRNKLNMEQYFNLFNKLFMNVILTFDDNNTWIVTHEDYNVKWFPNDQDNLFDLRSLFKENNVLNSYTGAVIFDRKELLNYSKDLLLYPTNLFVNNDLRYNNIDVSHSKLSLVIKITNHYCIDILSDNFELIKQVKSVGLANDFKIINYKGTIFK